MFYQDHILQGPSAVSAYICVEKIDNHTLISSFFISFISSSEASAKSKLKNGAHHGGYDFTVHTDFFTPFL